MKNFVLVFGVCFVLSGSLKAQEDSYFSMEFGLLQNSSQGLFTYTKFISEHIGFQGGVGMAGYDNSDFVTFEASALYAFANKRIWTFAGIAANDHILTPIPLAGMRVNALRAQNWNIYAGYRHVFRKNSQGYFSLGMTFSLPTI
jgi:hypothetical protein